MKPRILYEDEYFYVINKPNNLIVHHSYYARNIREKSVAEFLRALHGDTIYPVHRLDRKTSGVLLVAKQKEIAIQLQKQFEAKTIQKLYLALVRGFTAESQMIESPVKNAAGHYHEASTLLRTLQSVEVPVAVTPYDQSRYSLVELIPYTGRMHQLRKHMNKISHPIIGDTKYGNRHHNHMFQEQFGHSFLFLHALQLEFTHPVTDHKMLMKAPLPDFWRATFDAFGFRRQLTI